jgi:hypothetical protein
MSPRSLDAPTAFAGAWPCWSGSGRSRPCCSRCGPCTRPSTTSPSTCLKSISAWHAVWPCISTTSCASTWPVFRPRRERPRIGERQRQTHLARGFLRSPVLEAIVVVAKDETGGKKVLWQELRHQDLASETLLALPEVDAAFDLGRQSVAHLIEDSGAGWCFWCPCATGTGQVTHVVCAVANPSAPTWLAMLKPSALGSGSASLVDDKGRVVSQAPAPLLWRPAATTSPPRHP